MKKKKRKTFKANERALTITRVLSPQDTIVRLFMQAHEGRRPVSQEELKGWKVPEDVMKRLIDGSYASGGRSQE